MNSRSTLLTILLLNFFLLFLEHTNALVVTHPSTKEFPTVIHRDSHFLQPNSNEKKEYLKPNDQTYGYRMVLHRRVSDNKLEFHRRQDGNNEGGASNVPTPTSTRPVQRSPSPVDRNDEPQISPKAESPIASLAPTKRIVNPSPTTHTGSITPTSSPNSSASSSTPIIAGIVAGTFALAIACGGVYIFRKFQLKPLKENDLKKRTTPSVQHYTSATTNPSHFDSPHLSTAGYGNNYELPSRQTPIPPLQQYPPNVVYSPVPVQPVRPYGRPDSYNSNYSNNQPAYR